MDENRISDNALSMLLDKARLTLRITTPSFDEEILDIIQAGYLEMTTRGVIITETDGCLSPLIIRAIMTYVRLHFGDPENPDRLKAAYENQLGQLMTTSGFTNWG